MHGSTYRVDGICTTSHWRKTHGINIKFNENVVFNIGNEITMKFYCFFVEKEKKGEKIHVKGSGNNEDELQIRV